MFDDGHGTTHGRFTIPTLHGAILKKALLALAAPKHRAAVDGHAPTPGRPSDHRLGEAFLEYLERYPTNHLPTTGGTAASVVAMIDYDALTGQLAKAGLLDTGEKISPARRPPAGLQTRRDPRRPRRHLPRPRPRPQTPLPLTRPTPGPHPRTTRLHHHRLRLATRPLPRPPPHPLEQDGHTNRDGKLLCPRHHTLAHHPDYQTTHHPNGKVSFHRRE